jgi:hypothetical protein
LQIETWAFSIGSETKNSAATKLNLEAQNRSSGKTFGFAVILLLEAAAVAAFSADLFEGVP